MDIQLICMDLDGTALQNDRCSFSPRLCAALEEAHARGIAIVPVTGRQYGLLPPAVSCHPVWENLAVLCNGGQIRDLRTGEILHHLSISVRALETLLQVAKKYDLPIEFSVDSTLHLTARSLQLQKPWPELDFHLNTILASNGRIVEDLAPLCAAQVEKVNLLCISPELRAQVEQDLSCIPVSAVWTSSSCLEITPPDAKKGSALSHLSRLLQIPVENMMTLGDSGNDESMLRAAGLGIAMGNAPDHIKAIADAVTETNDRDGAAIAIEKYALTK